MHYIDEVLALEVELSDALGKAKRAREEALSLFLKHEKLIEEAVKAEIEADKIRLELEVCKLKREMEAK